MNFICFPANDEGYRQRRRALRACKECKRRRVRFNILSSFALFSTICVWLTLCTKKRCDPPYQNHLRCSRCARDDLSCSLVYENGDPSQNEEAVQKSPETKRKRKFGAAFQDDQTAEFGHPVEEIDATTASEGKGSADTIAIGSLHPASLLLSQQGQSDPNPENSEHVVVWVQRSRPKKPINADMLIYLNSDSVKAFDLPSRTIQDALVKLYFTSVAPLLPVINEAEFLESYDKHEAPILLVHAILMVASKHSEAGKYLNKQPVREFAESVHRKIKALLSAEIESDRLTLIRTLALLSLHAEGPEGLEGSSGYLSASIHEAHTMGIHLKRKKLDINIQNLWWSLWCLDRLQTCMNGRPIIIREEDCTIPLPTERSSDGAFQLMLKLFESLDKVIGMYRPLAHEGVSNSFEIPCVSWDFRQMLKGSPYNGPIQDKSTSDFLDLLFNTILILTYRPRCQEDGHWDSLNLVGTEHSLVAEQRLRAADRIIDLMSAEESHTLPAIPVVPYAVSLAMTVYYWEYRTNTEGARPKWVKCCNILKTLGPRWWIAESMSVLGKNVLHKLEKIPIAKDGGRKKQQQQEQERQQQQQEQQELHKADHSQLSNQQAIPEEQVVGLWQDGGLFDQLEGESFYDSDLFVGVDIFSNYLMVPELLDMPLQDNL